MRGKVKSVTPNATETRLLTCTGCGTKWREQVKRGPGRRFCDQCKKDRKNQHLGTGVRIDTQAIGYRLSRENSICQAGMRHAIGALKMGRPEEALEVLEIALSAL